MPRTKLIHDHFLKQLSQKPGYIHTEYKEVRNLLELYCKAKLVDEEMVELEKDGRKIIFYKLRVNDLCQAYRVVEDAWKNIW